MPLLKPNNKPEIDKSWFILQKVIFIAISLLTTDDVFLFYEKIFGGSF